MSRFESSFSSRSTHAQPAASTDWWDHVGAAQKSLAAVGGIVKLSGPLLMILGAGLIVAGEPFSAVAGLKNIGEGLAWFVAGNAVSSSVQTYGEAISNGANGVKKSEMDLVERAGKNFKSGLLRPW